MTFLDRIFGLLALILMIAYLGILGYFVPKPALVIVCAIGVLLAGVDFAVQMIRNQRH